MIISVICINLIINIAFILQLVGSGYFQAIGKAIPALMLTLSKQIFFLVPLLLILPSIYGLDGVWYAFPLADILSTILTVFYMSMAVKGLKKLRAK